MQVSEFQVLMPKPIRGPHDVVNVGVSHPRGTDKLMKAWFLFSAPLEFLVKEVISGEIIIAD